MDPGQRSEVELSESKRHHLLAQFCLERFAKDGNVELIDRNDFGRIIPSSVHNALAQNHFYSIETDDGRDTSVESFFAQHVEDPAAKAIRRLVEGDRPIIAPGIRDPICMFLAFQRVRGPAVRHMLVEQYKEVARKFASLATPSQILTLARERGEDMTEEEAAETAAFGRSGEYQIAVHREANLHLGVVLKAALEMVPLFNARRWRLLEFAGPMLVTCDEPVAFMGADPQAPGEAGGLARAFEVVYPIGPQHALVMIRPEHKVDQGRSPGTATQADIINLHVAFSAHRFIVRHPGTDPLRGLVLPKKAPSVFVSGDVIAIQQNASEASREKLLRRMRNMESKRRRRRQ